MITVVSARARAAQQTEASGHSGILESAKGVLEDLQSTGVLEQLMLHPPVSMALPEDNGSSKLAGSNDSACRQTQTTFAASVKNIHLYTKMVADIEHPR